VKNNVDGFTMVGHMDPIPDVETVPIYGKLNAVKGITDDERDQLLRELIWPIVI
jgi:hypothetical protein